MTAIKVSLLILSGVCFFAAVYTFAQLQKFLKPNKKVVGLYFFPLLLLIESSYLSEGHSYFRRFTRFILLSITLGSLLVLLDS